MIPCNSEFRAYALVRQKSVWRVRKHETQSYRESCVYHFSHFELYFDLHSCVLSTFQQHLLQFPTCGITHLDSRKRRITWYRQCPIIFLMGVVSSSDFTSNLKLRQELLSFFFKCLVIGITFQRFHAKPFDILAIGKKLNYSQ